MSLLLLLPLLPPPPPPPLLPPPLLPPPPPLLLLLPPPLLLLLLMLLLPPLLLLPLLLLPRMRKQREGCRFGFPVRTFDVSFGDFCAFVLSRSRCSICTRKRNTRVPRRRARAARIKQSERERRVSARSCTGQCKGHPLCSYTHERAGYGRCP